MPSEIIGFIGAGMAAIFFGSNYVPTKNYPTGDGMAFVWSFSAGVLLVGIASMFVAGVPLIYGGLIGGALWATGNMCVIPIVKTIGLGPGMLIWGSTSLLTGFLSGKLGLFGLHKQSVRHEALNWVSMLFVVASMIVFFFIKPTIEKRDEYQSLNNDPTKGGKVVIQEEEESSFIDRIPAGSRNIIGGILSIASGILYGVNMVPMMLWTQEQNKKGITPGTFDYVFSQFTGIYLYSTAVFIIYCIYNLFYGRPPKVYAAAVFPSMISGAMWGIAQCGLMSATQILGYAVGFPIGSAGPIVVSSLWSVGYFREIQGGRNYILLAISLGLLFTGIILLAVSK